MNALSLSCSSILSYVLCLFCNSALAQNVDKPANSTEAEEPYDVIIVPGVPYANSSFELVLKARMLWSKYLYEHKITKNIIYSGSSVYSPFVEGKIMRIYADSLNIPNEHTFSETNAEHSTENIYYSLQLAKDLGFKKIAVATDQYQILLIRRYIKQNCPEVTIIPIEYNKIKVMKTEFPEINPNSAYVCNFVSLPERESRLKRFKGTLGMNINYAKKDSVQVAYSSPFSLGIGKYTNPAIAEASRMR